MATPSAPLIEALRETAQRLEEGASYAWTHMGRCNCGHLAQTLTRQSAADIHRQALERDGDWTEQVAEFCPESRMGMDAIIGALLDAGLTTGDVADLEKLRNERILRRMPAGEAPVSPKRRDDVVAYLRAWAELLEDQIDAAAAGRRPRADAADAARGGEARGLVRVRF